MSGKLRPAWPGLHKKFEWPNIVSGWHRSSQEFTVFQLTFEIDRVIALFSVEFVILGCGLMLQLPIPETEESRAIKREHTMINQGLRTSIPLAEAIEHIKSQTGAKHVELSDEFLRQLRDIDENIVKKKEEK